MELTKRLEELVAPSLLDMGYEIVRVEIKGGPRMTVQIMAEPVDGRAMTVEDCARISHAVSAFLDVENPIEAAYSLEVSSPGIDRPLTRAKDFDRYVGHEAKVELNRPIDGRRRFRGVIEGMADKTVRLRVENQTVDLPLADLSKAKLVLTEALVAQETRH